MLKHAPDLLSTHEYFILWLGEHNARPWGTKAKAYSLFPEFELKPEGLGPCEADLSTGTGTAEFEVTVPVDSVIEKNEWVGATFRVGTTIAGGTGNGTITSNDAFGSGDSTMTVTATYTGTGETAPTSGSGHAEDDCYIVREGTGAVRKRGSYPGVRVLTPYQPVVDSATDWDIDYPVQTTGGRSLNVPSPYVLPSAVTTHEDMGLLLPLTMHEGITGWGISDVADSAGGGEHLMQSAATAAGNQTWTYATVAGVADHLTGGYVIIDWESDSVPKRSWNVITDSTTTTFVVSAAAWLGDGDPGDGTGTPYAAIKRWTAWVPHFNDSPYAYLPGEGYTYPNHDMSPNSGSAIGGAVTCTPRGISGAAYSNTFGAMLVAASRLSAALGKRVNVINLAVSDTRLAAGNDRNKSGFPGSIGWYNAEDANSWDKSDPLSLYARLDKLLRTILPNAMTAEANTASLYCLGIVFAQGESDAISTHARQNYRHAQHQFVTSVRSLIDTLSYNPYSNGAKVPFVHPRIAYLPHAIDDTYALHTDRQGGDGPTVALNADTLNLVNAAIEENTTADEFSSSIRVDDLPRDTTDFAIYSGVGTAELGSRIGEQLVRMVDQALGYGTTVLTTPLTRLVDICNLALSHVGDGGQITSLDDGSVQAKFCKKFLPEARDELLQIRQWGFATRRRQMVSIQKSEPGLYQHFEYCYVKPGDALSAFQVFPPTTEPTTGDFDYTEVTTAGYGTDFAAADGSGTDPGDTVPVPPVATFPGEPGGGGSGVVVDTDNLLPVVTDVNMKPVPYAIEQSPFGHEYIYTNQKLATLQYVAHVVDATAYSPAFASALACNLASKLAGAIIKGDKGEKVSVRQLQKAGGYIRIASSSDGDQQQPTDNDRLFGTRLPNHLAHR